MQDPLPNMDFNEDEITGEMPASEIGGSFIPEGHVIDYTFSKDAKENWDRTDIKQLISDVLFEYEEAKRGGYKPRDKEDKSSTFRLLPTEFHYEATKDNEIFVLHSSGQIAENFEPQLDGYSYVFVYRRKGSNRNLDVLKINDSNLRLNSIETFEVSTDFQGNPLRVWGISYRKNKLLMKESKRKSEYLGRIEKAVESVGFEIKMDPDKGYLWHY